MIWAHGSGGTRTDLLLPATWLAARGADASSSSTTRSSATRSSNVASDARQRAAIVQQVIDLRRSVDLLQSLPYVDPKRIGFMGLSFGAMQGALLAGTEPRIEAFDLQSGRGRTFGPGLDDLAWIRRSHAAFLFQLGLHDEIVPRAELVALAQAAPAPKDDPLVRRGHPLNVRANHDQLRWLAHELDLGGPVVRGAAAGSIDSATREPGACRRARPAPRHRRRRVDPGRRGRGSRRRTSSLELYRQLVLMRTYDERSVVYHRQGRIGTYAIFWNHEAMQVGAVARARRRRLDLPELPRVGDRPPARHAGAHGAVVVARPSGRLVEPGRLQRRLDLRPDRYPRAARRRARLGQEAARRASVRDRLLRRRRDLRGRVPRGRELRRP